MTDIFHRNSNISSTPTYYPLVDTSESFSITPLGCMYVLYSSCNQEKKRGRKEERGKEKEEEETVLPFTKNIEIFSRLRNATIKWRGSTLTETSAKTSLCNYHRFYLSRIIRVNTPYTNALSCTDHPPRTRRTGIMPQRLPTMEVVGIGLLSIGDPRASVKVVWEAWRYLDRYVDTRRWGIIR